MKTMKLALLMAALFALPVTGSFAKEASTAAPNVITDGDGAKTVRFENMHQTRMALT